MRRWRRAAKAHLPYVRRRQYDKLTRRFDALADDIGLRARRADSARLRIVRPVVAPLTGEVCLFLCHQRGAELSGHVLRHVEHFVAEGVQVILVLNADQIDADIRIDGALAVRLAGIYVRENVGFDFAGWAHAHALLRPMLLRSTRLFLVNDSIVGPTDSQCFSTLLQRVRASSADLVGLTEALTPLPHLQSFFLVFQRRLADGAELARFFDGVLCFHEKSTVIDVYETRFTRRMRSAGYACEALFPALSDDPHASNDTYFRWTELLALGFPYVKASVIREVGPHPALGQIVPR
jgi:hypothetical protein